MMLILLAAALQAASTSKPDAKLQPFSFRGLVAGEPIPAEQLKKCKHKADGVDFCAGDAPVAGHSAEVTIVAVGGRFSELQVRQLDRYYADLASALAEKYGKPCSVVVEQWQSRAGTQLDNPTTTWCFSTGKLKLSAHGLSRDWAEAYYIDDVVYVSTKPKVDF